MATGFPASTGDVLSAAMFNGLVAFTLNSQAGATYTLASTDQYQVLVVTSNASTKILIDAFPATGNPRGRVKSTFNVAPGAILVLTDCKVFAPPFTA
jgi:hypothetical protein